MSDSRHAMLGLLLRGRLDRELNLPRIRVKGTVKMTINITILGWSMS